MDEHALRFVVQWRTNGRMALIDFDDAAAALAFAGGLAERGYEPRLDGPLALDTAPREVREAAWARVAAAELADRAEQISKARLDVRALAAVVVALKDELDTYRRLIGEPVREAG